MNEVIARTFTVRGRVQGVGYRFFCHHNAAELGLTGWAKNASDGSVVVLAQGGLIALLEYERRLAIGPRLARVSVVSWSDAAVDSGRRSFAIH